MRWAAKTISLVLLAGLVSQGIGVRKADAKYRQWSGDRPIGRLERLAYQRHARDLKTGHKRGLWFDEEAGQHAVDFFHTYLHFGKGEWAGKSFRLSPWEEFLTRSIFGWMKLPEGMTGKQAARIPLAKRRDRGILRRFRQAYVELGRKNGKTEWSGGIGLYLLRADDEPGAEIYSVATKKDQARLSWRAADRMVRKSPDLRERIRQFRTALVAEDLDATFQPISSEDTKQDGLDPHGLIIDELHAHRTSELRDVLVSGAGSRRQPLELDITTAGVGSEGVCWDQRQYGVNILEKNFEDDTVLCFICTIDKGDDWRDEAVWPKANPNLGVSVKWEFLRNECAKARRTPTYQNNFRRKYLDEWVEQAERWMDMGVWRKCGAELDLEALRGRPCYLGIDLSRTIDLTAMAVIFPPLRDDLLWRVLMHCWVPEERIEERVRRDRVRYDVWVQEGHIVATPGNVVDYAFVEAALDSDHDLYDVQAVGIDPWNATKFNTDQMARGIEMVEVRQGPFTLSPAMKELERLILSGKIAHGNNPVLNWAMGNVAVRMDPNENIAPDKKKSTERIDPVSALVTGMAVALPSSQKRESIYNLRARGEAS